MKTEPQSTSSGSEQRQKYIQKLVNMIEPVSDAAEMLGVSRVRVHQLIKSGHLEAVKIGKQYFVDSLSLQERIDRFGTHPEKQGAQKVSG
jgi:excisionase family DNA binding protein